MASTPFSKLARSRASLLRAATIAALIAGTASAYSPHGGGGGGSGSSGSGSSGSGTSGSGGSGSNSGSGSWSSWDSGSNSGSGSSGWSGSGDTMALDDSISSNSGSGSSGSNSGSGSSGSNSGSSGSGSGSGDSSNSGSGSSNSGSGSSNSGSGNSGSSGSGHDDGAGWNQLAARENPELDQFGFPARRGEILAVDASKEAIRAIELMGFKLLDRDRLSALELDVVRLRAPRSMSAEQGIERLNAAFPTLFVALDHYFGVNSGSLDTRKGAAMVDMKVPAKQKLWIGIIDTAVWTNATLRSTRVDSRDFVNGKGASAKPPFAHGTAVASILARQGAVKITSANIFAADQRPYSSAEAIARAVDWMVSRKVPVINISIAGPRNPLVDKVIAAATARGHLIVAAAGNQGPSAPPAYPAASPGALAVTAVDRSGRVYLKANRGPHIEIAAFGVGIGAEAPDGTLKPHSGTSFAAPFVSAALARCMTRVDPRLSHECVRRMEARAKDLGLPGRDPVYGHGLLIP